MTKRSSTSNFIRTTLVLAQTCAVLSGLTTGIRQTTPARAASTGATADKGSASVNGPTDITGRAYNDFNGNGVMDTGATFNETPAPGLTVKAFASGALSAAATATTDATGTYVLTGLTAGQRYRVEFTGWPEGMYAAPHGANTSPATPASGTSVQFAAAGATNISFGILQPCDYCQNGPMLAVNYFFNGDPLKGGTASGKQSTVIIPYRSGVTTGQNATVAQSQVTGATWGLAYQRSTRTVYSTAIMKRHVGLGPQGIGGIYKIEVNGTNGVASSFVNLSALGIDLGADPRTSGDLSANLTEPSHDPLAYDAVGKTGFGDIDISEDEKTLWAINLKTGDLLEIFIDLPSRAPAATDIKRHPMPAVACTNGLFRPWAVGINRGSVYVGGVCSAESAGAIAANLTAHVFKHDPAGATGNFSPVMTFPLNYPRGDVSLGTTARWRPWINTWTQMEPIGGQVIWPQPILSDIEFDDDGALILGIQDRAGHQGGNNNYSTKPGDTRLYETAVGGDMLRACKTGASYALESNASCGGVSTAGANTNAGPGNGEFYFDESWGGYHTELSLGALALLHGAREVVSTAYDPLKDARAIGVIWMGSAKGTRTASYEVSGADYLGRPSSFGKASGLGDIELMCDPAPIEIGNRLWVDANQNGVQDGDEPPIVNATVSLYDAAGVKIGSVKTNGNGEYFFRSPRAGEAAGVIEAGSTLLSPAITPGTRYDIRLDNPSDYDGGPLSGFVLTQKDAAANASDTIDSDGAPLQTTGTGPGLGGVPGLYPTIVYTTGLAGQNDHTLDFGFVAPVEVGNQVWFDTNNNAVIDSAERGVPGVLMHLFATNAANGQILPTPIATATTAADGFYLFNKHADGTALYGGTFVIGVAPANFAPGGVLNAYHSSSTTLSSATTLVDATSVDTNLNTDNDDDGATVFAGSSQAGFYLKGVLSRPITVSAGKEPTGETSTDAQGATQPGLTPGLIAASGDSSSNLSVDFGFYAQILGNKVAYDANNSGIQEFGEPALNGIRVRLLDTAGAEIPVGLDGILGTADDAPGGTLTAVDPADDVPGAYYFKGLPAGEDIVEVERPPEYRSSTGTGNVQDDPVANPALEANVTDPDNNVNKDDNGRETGANNRIRGLPVTLDPAANPNLITGDPERGVTNDHRVDFAIYRYVDPTLYSVGNRLWFDANNDGLQNLTPYTQTDSNGASVVFDEMKINRELDGVKARIYAVDGAGAIIGAVVQTITVDAGGFYRFDNLPAGSYKIVVENPPGYAPTTGGSSVTPNDDLAGDDNAAVRAVISSTYLGAVYPAGYVESGVVTLDNNAEPSADTGESAFTYGPGDALLQGANDTRTNLNVDFGFIRARAMNLGNQVYDDVDDDGLYAPEKGDTPLNGVMVKLYKFNRSTGEYDPIADQVTRPMAVVENLALGIQPGTLLDGAYLFENLTPGDYIVELSTGNFNASGTTKVNGIDVPNGALLGYRSSTGSRGIAGTGPAEYAELDADTASGGADDDTSDVGLEKADGGRRVIRSNPVTLSYDGEPNQSATNAITPNDEELPQYNTNSSTDDVNSNLIVDFAVYRVFAVGNRVFFDSDNSGALNYGADINPAFAGGTDTPGIHGVTVTLHSLSSGVLLTTTTDSEGRYLFDNLLAGDYFVQIEPGNFAPGAPLAPRGIAFSSSDDIATSADANSDVDSDDNGVLTDGVIRSGNVTLGGTPEPTEDGVNNDLDPKLGHGQFAPDSQSNLSLDFGFYEVLRLGNLVWEDVNNNGTLDDGESPIADVPVYLYLDTNNDGQPDGTPIANTTTAPGGVYTFTVKPGTYIVEIAPAEVAALSVYTSSTGNVGAAVIGTNLYGDQAITYEANVPDPDALAGLNPDGIGINNDDNGFVAPNGRIRSKPVTLTSRQETVNDIFDEARNPVGYPFDSRNYSVDFGLYQPLSLGNLVWKDVPNLGSYQGDTTPGVDGVTVSLYFDSNGNGLLDPAELATVALQTTTNAGGRYLFSGLPGGEYIVALDAANFVPGAPLYGYISSDRAVVGTSGPFEPAPDPDAPVNAEGGSDPAGSVRDNDDSATLVDVLGAGGSLRTKQVTLRAGTEPTDEAAPFDNDPLTPNANENLTVDFGVYAPYSLGNCVWLDQNGNGLRDADEPKLVNVKINLRDAVNDTLYATTYSDAQCHYRFDALNPNNYVVEIDAANFFTGFPEVLTGEVITPLLGLLSTGRSIDDPNTDIDSDDNGIGTQPDMAHGIRSGVIAIGPDLNEPLGETDLKDEAVPQGTLLDQTGNMAVDFGFVLPASLGDRVWFDLDQDGMQDRDANGNPTEPDAQGITVTLYRAGTPISTSLTGLTGTYRFIQLEPGVPYSVSFALPPRYVWTSPAVGTNDDNSNVDPVTNATNDVILASGEHTPTLDAGLFLAPTLDLRKTVLTPGALKAGSDVTYQIVVRNTSSTFAGGVQIIDPIPANTSYTAGSAQPAATLTNNELVWPAVSLASGEATTVTFKVRVNATLEGASVITNVARLSMAKGVIVLNSNEVQNPLGPTAIALDRFSAELSTNADPSRPASVAVAWTTALELNTLGFNLWRSASGSRADAVKLNTTLIAASGASRGGAYQFADASGFPGASYWLEEIELGGASNWYGSVRVAVPVVIAGEEVQSLGGVQVAPPAISTLQQPAALAVEQAQRVVAGQALPVKALNPAAQAPAATAQTTTRQSAPAAEPLNAVAEAPAQPVVRAPAQPSAVVVAQNRAAQPENNTVAPVAARAEMTGQVARAQTTVAAALRKQPRLVVMLAGLTASGFVLALTFGACAIGLIRRRMR